MYFTTQPNYSKSVPDLTLLYITILFTSGVTCFVWKYAPNWKALLLYDKDRILYDGEWYRLLTCGFLHTNKKHLIGNMFMLYLYAKPLFTKVKMSNFRFLALYVGGIIGSSFFCYLDDMKKEQNSLSLGASGGVLSVMAATLVIFSEIKIIRFKLPSWLIFIFFLVEESGMKENDNINHKAHLGGMCYGVILSILMYPHLAKRNLKWVKWVCAGFLVLLLARFSFFLYKNT